MAEAPSITRIIVPTQLPVGSVNCYLVAGEEPALVDTGPQDHDAYERLEHGLRRAGVALSDLEVILITHGHVDHYGQAGRIAQASGAEVWVPQRDRDLVANFADVYESRREYYRDRLLQTGIPPETLDLVGEFFDYLKGLAEAAPVDRTFRDGERLSLGGLDLHVLHTPGHSPGSTCFQAGSLLFTGDTVLQHITPNAAFGGADGESVGMADYLASLQRLEALPIQRCYTGHGPPVDDLAAFIQNYRALYGSRRETLLQLLAETPGTAIDLVTQLLGSLPVHEVFLGLTEVLGHLEILEREGLVSVEDRSGVLVYGAAEA